MALCRVPETEFASSLSLAGRALDHCCGDGVFASLVWPDARFHAGCDLNEVSVAKARRSGKYERADLCDASQALPYPDSHFDLVFDNSALEHIPDLEGAVREVARVTRPGGTFAFNILNHRFYGPWWPLDHGALEGYKEWQPVFHILSIEQWTEILSRAGFKLRNYRGYFPEKTSRMLAEMEYEFSGYYLRHRPSKRVDRYYRWRFLSKVIWRRRLADLPLDAEPDEGAGYFVECERV
jgi:SAM-dependent methyltransferase